METDVLEAIRGELEGNADEKTRESASRFFREEVKFHGVKSSVVRKIATKYFQEIKAKEKDEIFSLCERLLESGYGEEAAVAFEWSGSLAKSYEPADFQVFERWIGDYVDNWAKCDILCNHTLGSFIEKYPEYRGHLKEWARSPNRWFRRASAVTLILPARKGMFLEDVLQISDLLLKDEDDLVQKGYGWMLKEASKRHQEEVYEYIMKRKAEMPRTALRYALEKMPEDLRKKAMER
ncbi:MAG: DNA alkylation repair enzyme [Methanosaeta sp. PtaU1.Bin060]|nr:MAG: DNA alkylation repair enzyme [Methanosaeta sp. PtaU1.Bin060]